MRIRPSAAGVVEGAVLAAAVAVPLHFNPQSQRVFEPDKLACLALLALTACAGMVALGLSSSPGRAPRPSPVDVVVAAAVVVLTTAAAASIAPALSVWGLYRRGQGLIALLALVITYAAARTALRRDGASERLRYAMALTTVPVSLYALLQRLGVDNIVWDAGESVVARPFGPLGNPIFLGAYLIVVMPVLGAWLLELLRGMRSGRPRAGRAALALGAGLLLATAALFLGQSRGPVLGLLAGGLTFAVLRVGQLGRPRAVVGLTVGAALAVVAAATMGQTGGERLGRLGELAWAGSRTAQERLLLWDALGGLAVQVGPRALLGHGPETTLLLLGPRLPEALARMAPDQVFDRAHNAVWEWWVAGGLAGVAVWLALYVVAFAVGLRAAGMGTGPRHGATAAAVMVVAAALGAGAAWALGGPGRAPAGLMAGLFGGLMLAVAVAAARRSGGNAAARPARSLAAPRRPARDPAGRGVATADGAADERLLAAALMAGLAAHLVESAVGLPTAAGELYFWLYLAWLAALAGRSAAPVQESGRPARRAAADAAGTDARRRAAWSAALVDGLALATVTLAPLLVSNRSGALGHPALWLLPPAVWVMGELLAGEPARPGWMRSVFRAAPAAALVALLAALGGWPGAAATAYAVVLLAVTVALGAVHGVGPASGGGRPAAAEPAVSRIAPRARRVALAAVVVACVVVGWRAALAPVVADAYVRRGLEAAARRDLPAARHGFERAVALWPQQAAYGAYVAAVWREDALRAPDEAAAETAFRAAEQALLAAERRVPHAEAALLLAGLYRERGDREEHPTARGAWWSRSAEWLDVALARSPWSADALLERGGVLERTGDAAAAGRAFGLAAELRPEVTAAWLGAARTALYRADAVAAERALRAAAEAVGPTRVAALAEADLQRPGAGPTAALAAVMARALAADAPGARAALQAVEQTAPGDPLTAAVRDWLTARGER